MTPTRTLWRGFALSAVALATSLSQTPAQGATQLVDPPPPTIVVAGEGGNQTNPSVSGDLVVYTDETSGSHVRFRSLAAGGLDGVVPNPDGRHHFLPDIDGTRIAFTEVNDVGMARIMLYDVTRPDIPPVSAHPGIGSGRAAALGGNTVVFHDLSFLGNRGGYGTEVSVVDLETGTLTRLTDDDEPDSHPAVSPDGSTVAWTKCAGGNTGCDIWMARKAEGWAARPVSVSSTEESLPSLDNTTIVYASRPAGTYRSQDLVAVPIAGGATHTLALGAVLSNPNISGGVVSAQARQADGAMDVIVWELAPDRYRSITETPRSEFLNELFLGEDGRLRVVWTVFVDDSDIQAAIVDLGGFAETSLVAQPVLRQGVGNKKSDRALEARLTRADTGAGVSDAEITFRAGTALLCVVRTDVGGVARCIDQAAFSSAVANGGYTVEFAGQPGRLGASHANGARVG